MFEFSVSTGALQIEPSTPGVMRSFAFISLCLVDVLVRLGTGQQHAGARVGPWRHRIQWENNGQLYSLLSTGTQYRSPALTRRRTQLLLTTKNSFSRVNAPVALSSSTRTRSGDNENAIVGHAQRNDLNQMDVSVLDADAGHYLIASRRPGSSSEAPPRIASTGEAVTMRYLSQQAPSNGSALTTIQEFSGAGAQQAEVSPVRSWDFPHSRGGRIISENSDSTIRSPAPPGWNIMSEDNGIARRIAQQTSLGQRAHSLTRVSPEPNVSPTASSLSNNAVEPHFPRPRPRPTPTTDISDPRDPHSIHHRNSVFYNVYAPDRRNRITAGLPGPGYGTRFFHNGEAGR